MNKKIGNLFKGDKGIWTVFFFLCLISIIEVFSASSTLSYKSHNFMGPIIYHAGTVIVGIIITIVTLNIPCRYFKLVTPVFLISEKMSTEPTVSYSFRASPSSRRSWPRERWYSLLPRFLVPCSWRTVLVPTPRP